MRLWAFILQAGTADGTADCARENTEYMTLSAVAFGHPQLSVTHSDPPEVNSWAVNLTS